MALSKILVPVEFSPRCLGSAQYAEALACHFHCHLVLLHVRVPPSLPYSAPDVVAYSTALEADEDAIERAQAQLEAFPIAGTGAGSVTRLVLEGDPARTIVEYAREAGCDLIVMSTHGYGPFRRFLLGSVTAKVLHDAACPVWTGPHLQAAPQYRELSLGTVLCALDLRPESACVLEWASGFAREFGARLRIVHVIQTSSDVGGFHFDADWHTELARQARAAIGLLQEERRIRGEVEVEIGEPAEAIREAAARMHVGLLVIGRGKHAGLLGRLRTNAYAILRESPCPVVAI